MQNDRQNRRTEYGMLKSDDTATVDLGGTVYSPASDVYGTLPQVPSQYDTAPQQTQDYVPLSAPKELTEEDRIKQGLMNLPQDLGIYNPRGPNTIVYSVLSKPDGKIQFEFALDDGESVTKQSFEEHFKRNGIPFISTEKGNVITVDPNSIANLEQLEKAREGIRAEMKIFHRELYPKEQNKVAEQAYKPIPAPAERDNEEKKAQPSIERVNQEFEKEKTFADALKERITLRNIAIALAVAVAAAAVVAACVFAFPAVAAVAGTAMAAVGISGASTAVIAGTCAGVAGAVVIGTVAVQDVSSAVGTAVGNNIKAPERDEHNAKVFQDKFPETNNFLKQINGVQANNDRNTGFDKDLKNLIRGANVEDLMIAVKRGDVAKIQELLPNKEVSEIQGALNKIKGVPEQAAQIDPKAKAQSIEMARAEAKVHAAQVAGAKSDAVETKPSKAETVAKSSGEISR